MLNPVFSLCVYLVEMVISYIFFFSLFEHRYSPIKDLLIGACLFMCGSAVNLIFHNNGTINTFTTGLINILFAQICFYSNLRKSLFYAALLGVVNVTLEVSVVFVSSFITGNTFLYYNDSFILLIFQALTIKTLYFLITLILVKIIRPGDNRCAIPLDFLAYPVSTAVCQAIFWHICSQPGINYHIQFLLSVASVCLFISSIFLFITYSHQVKKDGQAMRMQSELTKLQTEQSYYQILSQQNEKLMIYAHDAKKHLAAIQALNDDPQIENYVRKLTEQLADYTRNCHSGNKLLDVIIHKYTVDCEIRGIQFEYDVKVCNLTHLDDTDLVAILANLLDNALTAAEQSAEKAISLTTVHRNSYSVIVISNSCDIPPKQSGTNLISTKADSCLHGFGLKSVARTILKYEGDYEWEYDAERHIFTVTVMIADRY